MTDYINRVIVHGVPYDIKSSEDTTQTDNINSLLDRIRGLNTNNYSDLIHAKEFASIDEMNEWLDEQHTSKGDGVPRGIIVMSFSGRYMFLLQSPIAWAYESYEQVVLNCRLESTGKVDFVTEVSDEGTICRRLYNKDNGGWTDWKAVSASTADISSAIKELQDTLKVQTLEVYNSSGEILGKIDSNDDTLMRVLGGSNGLYLKSNGGNVEIDTTQQIKAGSGQNSAVIDKTGDKIVLKTPELYWTEMEKNSDGTYSKVEDHKIRTLYDSINNLSTSITTKNATVSNKLTVSSTASINRVSANNITVNKDLAVTGSETVGGDLTVSGTVTGNDVTAGSYSLTEIGFNTRNIIDGPAGLILSGENVTFEDGSFENLKATDIICTTETIGTSYKADGELKVYGKQTVQGNTNISDDLTVGSYITAGADITADGDIVSENDIKANGALYVDKIQGRTTDFVKIDGDVHVGSALAADSIVVEDAATNNIQVKEDADIKGNLDVEGWMSTDTDLTVGGNATVNGAIKGNTVASAKYNLDDIGLRATDASNKTTCIKGLTADKTVATEIESTKFTINDTDGNDVGFIHCIDEYDGITISGGIKDSTRSQISIRDDGLIIYGGEGKITLSTGFSYNGLKKFNIYAHHSDIDLIDKYSMICGGDVRIGANKEENTFEATTKKLQLEHPKQIKLGSENESVTVDKTNERVNIVAPEVRWVQKVPFEGLHYEVEEQNNSGVEFSFDNIGSNYKIRFTKPITLSKDTELLRVYISDPSEYKTITDILFENYTFGEQIDTSAILYSNGDMVGLRWEKGEEDDSEAPQGWFRCLSLVMLPYMIATEDTATVQGDGIYNSQGYDCITSISFFNDSVYDIDRETTMFLPKGSNYSDREIRFSDIVSALDGLYANGTSATAIELYQYTQSGGTLPTWEAVFTYIGVLCEHRRLFSNSIQSSYGGSGRYIVFRTSSTPSNSDTNVVYLIFDEVTKCYVATYYSESTGNTPVATTEIKVLFGLSEIYAGTMTYYEMLVSRIESLEKKVYAGG